MMARGALLLVAAALFMRALIPGGWMPAADESGLVRIVLCTGMGASEAWMDAEGNVQKDRPASEPRTDSPCIFTALAENFAPVLGITLELSAVRASLPVVHKVATFIGRGLSAPPPPATGPPSTL